MKGFWLAKLMGGMSREALTGLYAKLSASIADGTLHTPIEATYALEDIATALDHAHREGRDGKILVTPNGAIDG